MRQIAASELDTLVGVTFLVSAHRQPLPFGAHPRTRALGSPDLMGTDAAFVLYVLLDATLTSYGEPNDQPQGNTARPEERALRDNTGAFLTDLLAFKRYAFAAEQHRSVSAAFGRPDLSCGGRCRTRGRGGVRGPGSASGALRCGPVRGAERGQRGVRHLPPHQAHRTNRVITVLTLVSTVLLPAILIVNLFGVNLGASHRVLSVETPRGLALMLGCIALVSAVLLRTFRRLDWL